MCNRNFVVCNEQQSELRFSAPPTYTNNLILRLQFGRLLDNRGVLIVELAAAVSRPNDELRGLRRAVWRYAFASNASILDEIVGR